MPSKFLMEKPEKRNQLGKGGRIILKYNLNRM
jgi:hypothetical protein